MSDLSTQGADLFVEASRRRSQRAAEKRKRRRRRRTAFSILLALVVVGGAVYGAWAGIRPLVASLTEPDDYTGEGSGRVTVEIQPGAVGSAIATQLQQAGVVKTAKAFVAAYRANPKSGSVQAGTYALRREMSAVAAMTALLDEKNRVEVSLTLREGLRLAEQLDLISTTLHLPKARLTEALKDPRLGLPAYAKGNAEGMLFPATYSFSPTVTPLEALKPMVTRTTQAFTRLGVPAARQYSLLTQASLVEAESGRAQDLPKVARVLQNRLERGINLRLDTTVHYALNKFTLSTSIKDTQVNSPYNTYLHPGLPPAPICAPGEAAMRAVLNPTPGPWLYFVTTNPDTKETKFAVTETEFAKYVAEYQVWQKAHPGQ